MFYPKLPRSWIPDGIILVPCLNEKGVKGAFELDVYASGSLLTIRTQYHISSTVIHDRFCLSQKRYTSANFRKPTPAQWLASGLRPLQVHLSPSNIIIDISRKKELNIVQNI